jgi:hypothetical protein
MPRKRKTPDRLPPLSRPVSEVTAEVAAALRVLPRWSHWSPDEFDGKVNAAARELARWRVRESMEPESIPPELFDEFDTYGEPVGVGRPPAIGQIGAAMLELYCANLTGSKPHVNVSRTQKAYGAFYDLVSVVFAALELRDNPERAARWATKSSGLICQEIREEEARDKNKRHRATNQAKAAR